MRGYILDVNHVEAYFAKNPSFMERFREVPPDTQMRVCAITVGEIEAGHGMTDSTDGLR